MEERFQGNSDENLSFAVNFIEKLKDRMADVIKGRDDAIELILIALLADGHILLEDYPGSGKTTLAKTLGESIIDDKHDDKIVAFRRIQFTPDLLPSDITGVSIFDADTGTFHFREGPLFAHVVLADEINRTSPKVQSAMLEAMAEKQVTVDNTTYKLDDLFFVIATQNPLDLAGTYPLPVAQLDRFLFKVRMTYIDRMSELKVMHGYIERRTGPNPLLQKVARSAVIKSREITENGVYIHEEIKVCMVDIARSLREHEQVLQGVSTRSLVLALPALQARALIKGRDYVDADDIVNLSPFIFGHRIELAPGSDEAFSIINQCIKKPIETLSRYSLRA